METSDPATMWRQLIRRVLTIIVLAPLLVGFILLASKQAYSVLIILVMCIALWEWSAFVPIEKKLYRSLYVLSMGLVLTTLFYYVKTIPDLYYFSLSILSICLLAGAFGVILRYPKGRSSQISPLLIAFCGFLWLTTAGVSLVRLRLMPEGIQYILYLLALIWMADVGGYVIGKIWGCHKMIPQVSPKKTWEGLLGSFCFAVSVAIVWGFKIDLGLMWIGVSIITIATSVVGDLVESMLKRTAHLKDSGSIFPGHGGMLDRIDSLIPASIVFVTLGQLFGFLK